MPTWRSQVRLDYPGTGGPGFNTFHARTTGDTTGLTDLTGLIENFYTGISTVFAPTTKISHDGVWTGVGNDVGALAEEDPWELFGSDSSGSAPNLLCLLVTWRTDRPGRTGRGKSFIGPLSFSTMNGIGQPAASRLTNVRAAATALIDGSNGLGNGSLGLYSPAAGVFVDWTSYAVGESFAYLSSRRD